MKTSIITLLSLLTVISFVSAQRYPSSGGSQLLSLLALAHTSVSQAVLFLIGVAMVVFFCGLVMFIWKGKEGGDELAKSKQFMINSLIAIFVMVSIWEIISLIQNILGVNPTSRITAPVVSPLQ